MPQSPEQVWIKTDNGYVADISDLQGNGVMVGDVVRLVDGRTTNRSGWEADKNNGEITGWRKTINGVRYLIVND